MDTAQPNLAGLLARSRLFTSDEAKAIYQRWLGEARGGAGDLGQFTKWLVSRDYLTEYQATLLCRGHTDGFFLNQYKILERIGRGRMAGVYKAVHSLGQVVAIKVLPPSRARDPQLLARFQREARLTLRLKHPNIVRAYQVGEVDGHNYLVLEYLEGETLDEVFQRRGRLPPAEAVRLVHQALLGLQHLHEQGLVHRDLKPANLMVVPAAAAQADTTLNATVKILDIGLGRVLYDESAPERQDDPQLTGAGVVLGTPDYMAPEQGRDARSADIRSDIYSLGCVLYHALTGQPPFPDTSLINQMIRHATEPARPLKEFNSGIPDGLQQIMNWMLAKEPAQRYPTPERAAQALQVFLVGEAAVLRPASLEPQLRSYLEWLDKAGPETSSAPALPQTPAAKVAAAEPPERPATKTPAPVPVGKPATKTIRPGATVSQASRSGKAKTKASIAPPPEPAEIKAAAVSTPLDVELVPVVAPPKLADEEQDAFHLTRRDFLMLGIGAGGVLFAVFVGWLLAFLLGRRDKETLSPTNPTMPKSAERDKEAGS
jgi:serine/threonine protein kinase